MSECASSGIRGRLGSLTASSLALGIWMTYIVGSFVEWYVLAWVFGCLPVAFLLGTLFLPESPSWLLANGREQEARQSIQLLRGKYSFSKYIIIDKHIKRIIFAFIRDTNIDAEVERIKEHQEKMSKSTQNKTQLKDIFTGPVMKPLFVSLGLMLFQQTTGVNAIIFHTVSIFQSAGSTIDERSATIIVGAVQLIFTVASGFLVGYFIVSFNKMFN